MSNFINDRIAAMLEDENENIKKLAIALLNDCKKGTVDEVTTRYKTKIKDYLEEGRQ